MESANSTAAATNSSHIPLSNRFCFTCLQRIMPILDPGLDMIRACQQVTRVQAEIWQKYLALESKLREQILELYPAGRLGRVRTPGGPSPWILAVVPLEIADRADGTVDIVLSELLDEDAVFYRLPERQQGL